MSEVGFTLQEVMKSKVVATVSGHEHLRWAPYFNKDNAYCNFLASIVGQNCGEKVLFLDSEEEAINFVDTRL